MPGWYIHKKVARKAIAALDSNSTAAPLFAKEPSVAELTALGRDNSGYVALGAIGPDIFFLLPDFKPPVGNVLWNLATTIRESYTCWDDNFPVTVRIGDRSHLDQSTE